MNFLPRLLQPSLGSLAESSVLLQKCSLLHVRWMVPSLSRRNGTSTENAMKGSNAQSNAHGTTKEDQKLDLQGLLDEKTKLLEEKSKEAADFKDKYLRALAEAENIRSRGQKLVADAKIYGIQSFSKDLLEVADILDKATEGASKEAVESNPHLKSVYEGLAMTSSQLQKVFAKHGLEKLNPIGEKFDPNFHEALFVAPFPDKQSKTVAVVEKVGYRLGGRPLRPALVGVVQ